MTTLQLRRGKSESLKRFHPWIFSGALRGTLNREPLPQEGEVVDITKSVPSPCAFLPSVMSQ